MTDGRTDKQTHRIVKANTRYSIYAYAIAHNNCPPIDVQDQDTDRSYIGSVLPPFAYMTDGMMTRENVVSF